MTQANLGKPLSIYLDDKLISSPTVKSVITDGTCSITDLSPTSVMEMKELLNAGSLPAKLIEKQVTSVTASLGEQALHKSLMSGYVAVSFILLFMLIVYRLPGLMANIALLVFIYLCLVFLDWMNATLTLSGIAGFVLAVGMAVDANIITFERIQEELRNGKSLRSAFRTGQRSSLTTILDAHVTTLIAALVLMTMGTDSIKGFAIVLMMTILVSLLTNVLGVRMLLWLVLNNDVGWKRLWWFGWGLNSNRKGEPKRKLDIVRRRKLYLSCSFLILILGLTVVLLRGVNLGVDFQSGTRLDLYLGKPFEATDIVKAVQDQLPSAHMKPVVKYGKDDFYATTTISKPVTLPQLQGIEKNLQDKYGSQVGGQESTVDPIIADEMVKKAVSAIIVASACIILYLAIRFHYLFGVACIAALLHDILIPVALFSILHAEINLTFISAILTIVGYSLNDTIVIFDRIRTNMKTAKITTFRELEELVNASLRQTMKRSLYTVLTVCFAAFSLLWLGGSGVHLFALALAFGLVSGAYSSIFITAQLWLMLYRRKGRRTGIAL